MDETERAVIDLARRHIESGGAAALSEPDADLSALGLDSLGKVGLIIDIEAAFSIEFPPDMIDAQVFSNARTIANAVKALRER